VPPRKERVPVVLDTNIIIGFYLSRSPRSAGARIFQLWRDQRKLQLIVSREVVEEYLEVLARVRVNRKWIDSFAERMRRRETVTYLSLGSRPTESRDPDDNLMLAAAVVGKAKYLVTNDRDLLDIPSSVRKKLRFSIVTPAQLLAELEGKTKV
jgi:uncharacterized protein